MVCTPWMVCVSPDVRANVGLGSDNFEPLPAPDERAKSVAAFTVLSVS